MDERTVRPPEIAANSRVDQAVLKAAHFAAKKHAGQRRKGAAAEPYINHLLEVAELVCSALAEPDTNLVIAALLHDAVEDTGTTKQVLVETFGSDVADLVMEMTDDKSLPKAERKRLQTVHASQISVRAQVIKLADKISNLRGIVASPPADWSGERKREYFEWAKQVVDGLSAPNEMLKAEFERLYRQVESLASS
jgi:guanosine-3',5'-bis(diphosphate) 3'-pyrophosphohydrolase